jgi:hypothetical protein
MFAKFRIGLVFLILLTACTSVTNTPNPGVPTVVPVQTTALPSAAPPNTVAPTQAQSPTT